MEDDIVGWYHELVAAIDVPLYAYGDLALIRSPMSAKINLSVVRKVSVRN